MSRAINIHSRPTWRTSRRAGAAVRLQTNEAGKAQADEAGNFLKPDPEIVTVHGDEANHALTNENGAINLSEP